MFSSSDDFDSWFDLGGRTDIEETEEEKEMRNKKIIE
jgi:hypothetical protein